MVQKLFGPIEGQGIQKKTFVFEKEIRLVHLFTITLNSIFFNNKNTSHHSLSVLDDKLKQKMKSPKQYDWYYIK